jgi:MFS family permease
MLARGLARRLPVLEFADFRLLLADRALAPAAYAFSLVGVSFAVLYATGSTADLSYVLAAQIAPALVFSLIGGVVADRIPPQRVIVAANLAIAVGEGGFGILVLAGRPALWQMILLETLTGTGMALFYPASNALLPMLVPPGLMQQASAISRLVMNSAQMIGAFLAGFAVAAFGAGWALSVCALGMLGTVPLLLAIRAGSGPRPSDGRAGSGPLPSDGIAGAREAALAGSSLLADLREGWSEFRSHVWLWTTTAQFAVVLAAWYGGFQVLGPVAARAHLGGPAAWGAITGAESVGLIAGGLGSLRFTPRRPILFVVLIGGAIAVAPLSLAMLWPVPAVCAAAFLLGAFEEIMMVQWTVTLARRIPAGKLARVSAYDVLGSVLAMPAGALVAGPLAAAAGVSAVQYGAAALIVAASVLGLLPREVRGLRSADGAAPVRRASAASPVNAAQARA